MVKKIEIEGIAITEGKSRNGIMYTAEELHKFANTLAGRPILKDHDNKTDNAIGKVIIGESIDNGKKVKYKGWIKEDGSGITEKIKDGRICEVSIGAMAGKLIKESEDSDYTIAKDLVCLELSTTPVPGVVGTSIAHFNQSELTEEKIKEIISDYIKSNESYSSSNEDKKTNCKEVKMENSENKIIETVKVDESVELKAKLAESEKMIASLKEAQRQDAISAYKVSAKGKGIDAIDVSNMTIESIKALTLQLESFKMPVVETKVEEKKEVAKTQSAEIVTETKTNTAFEGYVIEHSDLGGLSFYKVK